MKAHIFILALVTIMMVSCTSILQADEEPLIFKTYTVQEGDTVFGIADRFGLKPQTILWSNFDMLHGDPHALQQGMKLSILPVDGLIYEWKSGDSLSEVAARFSVHPKDILRWPGNGLDLDAYLAGEEQEILLGRLMVIPGGQIDITP